jgi:hypothetical protein
MHKEPQQFPYYSQSQSWSHAQRATTFSLLQSESELEPCTKSHNIFPTTVQSESELEPCSKSHNIFPTTVRVRAGVMHKEPQHFPYYSQSQSWSNIKNNCLNFAMYKPQKRVRSQRRIKIMWIYTNCLKNGTLEN